MIKGLIFCVDGVIADISDLHHGAWEQICRQTGCTAYGNDFELLRDLSGERAMRMILDFCNVHYRENEIAKLCEDKKHYYLQAAVNLVPSAETRGIRQFIHQASVSGFKTCALSADNEDIAVLDQLGLADSFDIVIARDDTAEILLRNAADELGCVPNECILFSRSVAFISAARTLSMRTVGFADPETAYYGDYFIRNFMNLNVQILVRKTEGE